MNLEQILLILKNQFQYRTAQEQMMRAVHSACFESKIAVIEAGTGIGKTFAYLLPSLLSRGDRKIIVSTASVSLQEQLCYKDLPTVQSSFGLDFEFLPIKGRRRYVCPLRLTQVLQDQQHYAPNLTHIDDDEITNILYLMYDTLANGSWDGDMDNWPEEVDAYFWSTISTDRFGCLGKRCPQVTVCPYWIQRKKFHDVDVLVINHDLLLSDIFSGSQFLLNLLKNGLLIIDEAHVFANKTLQYFSKTSSFLGAIEWLADVPDFVGQSEFHHKIFDEIQYLSKILEQAYFSIKNQQEKFKNNIWQLKQLPSDLNQIGEEITVHSKELLALIIHVREDLLVQQTDDEASTIIGLGFVQSKLENLLACWKLLCQQDKPAKPSVARWFSIEKKQGKGGQDFYVHASPIAVADRLQVLWQACQHSVILCSATLRALGKFQRFLNQTGLSHQETLAVETHYFASPFDYQRSQLVIPAMQYEPTQQHLSHYIEEVIQVLPKIIQPQQSTLVLFSSWNMMNAVYQGLTEDYQQICLIQGEYSRKHILERHKHNVDQDQWSMIFGLQSFAEGIDLPGKYCEHVIITRLPFVMPQTPIELTRAEWLSSQGKNPFTHYALPLASLRLTQAVGRLIRQESDQGQVTILDRRIVTKKYGKYLLDNLPNFSLCIE